MMCCWDAEARAGSLLTLGLEHGCKLRCRPPQARAKPTGGIHGNGEVTWACTVWRHPRSVTAARGCRPADPVWAAHASVTHLVPSFWATDGPAVHGLGASSYTVPELTALGRQESRSCRFWLLTPHRAAWAGHLPANGSSSLPSMVFPRLGSTHYSSDVMLLNRGHVREINGPMFGTLGVWGELRAVRRTWYLVDREVPESSLALLAGPPTDEWDPDPTCWGFVWYSSFR